MKTCESINVRKTYTKNIACLNEYLVHNKLKLVSITDVLGSTRTGLIFTSSLEGTHWTG